MTKWRSLNSARVKSVRCSVCRIGIIRTCPWRSGKSSYITKKYLLSNILDKYFLQSKQSLPIFDPLIPMLLLTTATPRLLANVRLLLKTGQHLTNLEERLGNELELLVFCPIQDKLPNY